MLNDFRTTLTIAASSLIGVSIYMIATMALPAKLIAGFILLCSCALIYFSWRKS